MECFNCGAIWSPGTEEYDFECCASCGWSVGMPLNDHDFDNDDAFDDDDDSKDPNDSRNL